MYQRQADYLVEQLNETQIRMIDAERICNKIYMARNITLSEKCVVSALAEIDKRYRTQHDGN
jgi:tetrahydrodipicolinate N-succinyltransferase